MRIGLTGATGFIGRHVLTELMLHDVEVVALTRYASKISHLNKVQVIQADLNSDADFYYLMGAPDALIHLAWDGLPNYKSLHHFEAELPRQYKFIKHMVESGLSSLFVTGTCFEYGMQSGALSAEMKTEPANPYGYAKDALRKQLELLKNNIRFNLTWGRLFYMYGEGQAENSLYPNLKQAVLRGDKVFHMSGGQQLRDYLPIETVAERIVRMALEQRDIGVTNICSGKPISVGDLVQQWIRENGWDIDLNLGYYPYSDYEPMSFWGSNIKYNGVVDSDYGA
jgi:dTDP-6-deoxy-L-talose 4-dehydrogenase (NAD+)